MSPAPQNQAIERITRILVIRLHAIGDVALTLPACHAIMRKWPDARIDFLTSESIASMVKGVKGFNRVFCFPPSPGRFARLINTLKMAGVLSQDSYQLVFDFQANWVSRMLRMIIRPEAWSEFDRTSPIPSAERVANTVKSAGLSHLEIEYRLSLDTTVLAAAKRFLEEHGWNPLKQLLLLNPAGLWKSRQWPVEHFSALAEGITKTDKWQILFMGTDRIQPRVDLFLKAFHGEVINLVGKTKLDVALGVLQYVSLTVSEDSGLMHMSWVSGVPTIALLGSTRSDWARPLGAHTHCLDSSDLPCGSCMKEECVYGDVHCLTRYTPAQVLAIARDLTEEHRKVAR